MKSFSDLLGGGQRPGPLDFSFDFRTTRRVPPEELRLRRGLYGVSILIIWVGPRPKQALKVISKILQSILKCTESQWREARMGVM